jgi:predicted HicB family RNase H-like nuclease
MKPTSIKIGDLSDKKSLKSKLAKKAAKEKKSLHCLIVTTLTESI